MVFQTENANRWKGVCVVSRQAVDTGVRGPVCAPVVAAQPTPTCNNTPLTLPRAAPGKIHMAFDPLDVGNAENSPAVCKIVSLT